MIPHPFDYLEKIEYTSELLSVYSKMEFKVLSAKQKNPNLDLSEQQKMIDDLKGVYIWVSGLFEEKELLLRHNMNLERLNLELKEKLTTLEKQVKINELIETL